MLLWNKQPDVRCLKEQVQCFWNLWRTIFRFGRENHFTFSLSPTTQPRVYEVCFFHFFCRFGSETSTFRLSSSKPNITYANWGNNLPSSFQVTCALSVKFGFSSISPQQMTAVYPWCVEAANHLAVLAFCRQARLVVVVLLAPSRSLAAGYMQNTDS